MLSVDLNCDMGEGMPNDDMIIPWISSVNIACGYHAGNADTMKRTVDLALQYNTAIGAHPGFNDKENFGRKEKHLSDESYYILIREQLHLLQNITAERHTSIHHVKPHGALYNMSAGNAVLAAIIARAVKDHDPQLVLYGLSNSYSITEADKIGLKTASEVFADRTYTDNGFLTPRSDIHALITNEEQSLKQVLQMVKEQTVSSVNKKIVEVKADTICIHGDSSYAAGYAKKIFEALKENGICVKAIPNK